MGRFPRELTIALLLGTLLAVTSGCLTPIPGPGPGPSPNAWASVVAAGLEKVDDTAEERAKLASSFEVMASQIAAGVLKDKDAIQRATRQSNLTAIGAENRQRWLPFFEHLQQALIKAAMTDPQKIAAAWRQIAEGLRDAK